MKTKFYFLSLVLILAVSAQLYGQELLPNGWMPNGMVNTITTHGDMVYVGGSFTTVTRPSMNGAVIDTETGQHLSTLFPAKELDQVLPDYAGGFFINGFRLTHVNGIPRRKIAHILANGTLSDFNPILPIDHSLVNVVATTADRVFIFTRGNSLQNTLHCVDYAGTILWSRQTNNRVYNGAVKNSTLYIGGAFTTVEGQPRQRAAAFNINTGSLLAFNTGSLIPSLRTPPLVTSVFSNIISIGVNGNEVFIRYSASNLDSRVVSVDAISGESNQWSIPSVSNIGELAMMVHNGRMSLGTSSGTGFQIFDCVTKEQLPLPAIHLPVPGTNRIKNFSALGTKIFFTANSILDDNNNSLGEVVSFDTETNEVTSYNVEVIEGEIKSLCLSSNRLYCGGKFPGIKTAARMNFYAFNKVTSELSPLSFDFESDENSVNGIIATDNRIYLDGFFGSINGQPLPEGLASIDKATGAITDWNPEITYTELDYYAPTQIFSGTGNEIYVAGGFTDVKGLPRNNIAKFNGSTGELEAWNTDAPLASINEVAVSENVIVLAGTSFDQTRNEIRFLDAASGLEILTPIEYDINDEVKTMRVLGNVLYVGGSFENLTMNNIPFARDRVAAIDITNGSILDFSLTFESGSVNSIDGTNGTLYLAGEFQKVNGFSRSDYAAIDLETGNVTDWHLNTSGGSYSAVVKATNDAVYVGGEFFEIAAPGTPDYYQHHFGQATPDRSNRISGRVFYDYNQNGIQDGGENGIPNLLVELQPGNIFYPTDQNGDYSAYSSTGQFTIRPTLPNYTIFVSPPSRDISFDEFNEHSASNNFGLAIQANVTDLSAEITSDQSARPGFYFNYIVTYKNVGTVASNATITVDLDERLLFQTSSVQPTNAVGNNFTYNYANLAPGQSQSITINVRVPVPTPEENMLGELLEAIAIVTPSVADNRTSNNTATLSQNVIGSFDPNDKLVTPAGDGPNGYIAENTESLEYTIRFQNMGNAPATFVIVTDEIDQNLDVSSFTFIAASHAHNFEIVNGILTVNFGDINNPINLPAEEVDEPGSHGFFTFRISLKNNLPRHTRIENSASIVFDFNLPITTNTTVNTLLDPPYSTKVYVTEFNGDRNTEVIVPVQVEDFDNILAQQFSVSWDPTVVTFVGVEQFGVPGSDITVFNTANTAQGQLTYAWLDPTSTPQTLADASTLFAIRFSLTGNYGASTAVSISNHPTPIEAINENYEPIEVERVDGSIEINPDLTIGGTVLYPNGEAVQNVSLGLTGSETLNVPTNEDGEYSFTVHPDENSSYTITPSKSDDPNLLNGIDVQDLILIRRHILHTTPFSSNYEYIAADASNNSIVSIQDLAILQALILGIETNFPNGRQWAFIDATFDIENAVSPFPYPQSVTPSLDDLGQQPIDFTAIKVGDVNLSRDNSQAGRTKMQEVIFEIMPIEETDDEVLTMTFSSFGFVDISGYQFTMNWNPAELEWIENQDDAVKQVIGTRRVEEGILTALWDDPAGYGVTFDDATSLFKTRFRKISETLTSKVTINGVATPVKMYSKELEPVNLTIREGTPEERIESGTFYPNPFVLETKISFTASESQDARFEIIDVTGKAIQSHGIHIEKGWNEKVINGERLQSGVYIFKLQLRDKVIKGKMIKGRN